MNYVGVTELIKDESNKVSGVVAVDSVSGKQYTLQAKVVINATGIFVDNLMKMDAPEKEDIVRPSQGVHLVVDKSFLGGDTAIMIPKTSDGRVLFGVPWHDKVVLGTTDTPLKEFVLEPKALEEEIDLKRRYTAEERDAMFHAIIRAMEIGDQAEADRLLDIMPIHPRWAKITAEVYGKNFARETFNLTHADEVFGEGWLDAIESGGWLDEGEDEK